LAAKEVSMRVTGHINFRHDYGDDALPATVKAKWEGGDVVAFTQELFDLGRPWLKREGDIITACQYHMKVVEERDGVVYARRIDGS
jgi:hypothetical protein